MGRIKSFVVFAVFLAAFVELSVTQNTTLPEESGSVNTTVSTTETNNTGSVEADAAQGNTTSNNATSSSNATIPSVTSNDNSSLSNKTSESVNSTVTPESNTTSSGNNTGTTPTADSISNNSTITNSDNTTATNNSSSTNETTVTENGGTSTTSSYVHFDADSMTVYNISEGCSYVMAECFTTHFSQASVFDYCELYQRSMDCLAEPLYSGYSCNVTERARVETLFCSPDNLHVDVQDACKARLTQCMGPVLGTTYTEEAFKQGACLALDIGGCLDVNSKGAVCTTQELEEIKEHAECSAAGLASSILLVAITFFLNKFFM